MSWNGTNARALVETRLLRVVGFAMGGLAPLASRASVPILFVALAAITGLATSRRQWPTLPNRVGILGFGLLILWCALSASWASAPADALRSVAGLAILVSAGLMLIAWARDSQQSVNSVNATLDGVRAGLVLGLIIYAFEGISWGWLTRIAHGFSWQDIIDDLAGGTSVRSYFINGTAILSLLLWPAMASPVPGGRVFLKPVLVGLIVIATAVFGSDSGLIALALGAVCWAAAMRWGARATRTVAVLFAIVMLTTPYLLHRALHSPEIDHFVVETQETMPSSALLRLYIWKFTTDRIAERPMLGWGFNSARSIPGGGDKFVIRDDSGQFRFSEFNIPLHPHNQILQIWLELGAIGALIVAAAGACLIDRLGRWLPRARASGLALVGTVIVYDSLSFGVWQSWWIAAVFVAFALLSPYASESR